MDSTGSQSTGAQLDGERRAAIVRAVADAYERVYVVEESAAAMAALLRQRLRGGAYDEISEVPELTKTLTSDLGSVVDDRHVVVYPSMPHVPFDEEEPPSAPPAVDRTARVNHGFSRAEILLGNVGYLELRHFHHPEKGADAALAAMGFLANVDALIVDLRDNGGGEDTMDHLLAAHLFDERTHLCTHEYRVRGESVEWWTDPDAALWRRPAMPLYVLIGRTTFSAAEGFAYNLQARGRAVVVGERSRGGGHTVEFATFPDLGVEAMIPNGRAINPITNGNWEATGVLPDIEAPDVDTLNIAHREALRALIEAGGDGEQVRFWRWALGSLESRLGPPVALDRGVLESYAGHYGTVQIRLEDGALWLSWDGRRTHQLAALENALFEFDGGRERVRFLVEDGDVRAAVFETQEGDSYRVARSGSPDV
jgi:hypothetical protein